MLNLKQFLIALTLLSPLQSIYAKPVILISDVDDTIKQSAIKYRFGKIRALRDKTFFGMADLYTSLLCSDQKDNVQKAYCRQYRGMMHSSERWLVYVSGAPGTARALGQTFLTANEFPSGPFFNRKNMSESTADFKFQIIGSIISGLPDREEKWTVILVGDNGEDDIQAYSEIAASFGEHFDIKTYIHQIYDEESIGKKLAKDQIGYFTSLDLAQHFLKEGWINANEFSLLIDYYQRLMGEQSQAELKEIKSQILPSWTYCQGFFQDLSSTSVAQADPYSKIMHNLQKICMAPQGSEQINTPPSA